MSMGIIGKSLKLTYDEERKMNIEKTLDSIALQISEPEYRAMPELSYSTLSTYEKTGYDGLDHLFDKKETPSLLLGSLVDTLLTEGEDEFNKKYCVLDVNLTDGGMDVATQLLNMGLPYASFEEIPEYLVSQAAKDAGFWKADKWDKIRYREVLKTGNIGAFYNASLHTEKVIVDSAMYNDALAMVRALRSSVATAQYFAQDDPFSPIKRYYQLKFKAVLDGVGYRCMSDLLVVDYENKVIFPCDLKTSGKTEWNFEGSFEQWQYMIQARLYWRIIRANLDKDPYFKDFKLEDYRFIVVNKNSLTPLVWEFPYTTVHGTLVDERGNEFRDPFEIGKELRQYLDCRPPVPNGINLEGINVINCLKPKVCSDTSIPT